MNKLPAARRETRVLARMVALLGFAAAFAGCQLNSEAVVDRYPHDDRQRHPISIREAARTVEIFIGAKRGSLTPNQRGDVIAFAHAWLRESTGGIVIDVPAGTVNERAAADALHEIRSMLIAIGIPSHAIEARPYRPVTPIKLATVRLNYPKMIAEAGPCGTWPRDLGPSYDAGSSNNYQYWNLGCANQRNLAAMVDYPPDLVQPRGETAALAARRSTV